MTPIQKHLMDQTKQGKELTLDSFGEIMDDFITKFKCQMLITFPEGSGRPEVQENMGIGPVGEFYFILKAITPVFRGMIKAMKIGDNELDKEKVADAILSLVRAELLEEEGADD